MKSTGELEEDMRPTHSPRPRRVASMTRTPGMSRPRTSVGTDHRPDALGLAQYGSDTQLEGRRIGVPEGGGNSRTSHAECV